MKNIKTLGLVLVVLGLMVVPAIVLAQAALSVTITTPASGTQAIVGQSVNFAASATGGDPSSYNFGWNFGDGTEVATEGIDGDTSFSHVYTEAGTKTVEIAVSDLDNNRATDTIMVNVVEATDALAISNIQVGSVTTNSAVITWTTNKPATSRVVYDTASHAGEVDAENDGPNYGYANSTDTADTDPLVTSHSVTLTGLSANTQYFFRVISEVPAN